MPNLVFELGTEEMPAGAIEGALQQLLFAVEKGLNEARLGAEKVAVYGTPRRLILTAVGVPERQPDQVREVRGPSKAVAYDAEGKPTGAAIGFARKQGVPVEALQNVSTPQGEYVLARVHEAGKPAVEVLGPLLSETVRELFFPKMMRWGMGAMRFARPIRWILALLGEEVVPMEVGGIASGRRSRGHRFLAPGEFEVPHADALLKMLRAAYVMFDPEERRQSILEQGDRLAAEVGGRVPWEPSLLDENTWLVEWPTALMGSFDPDYLSLPRPVLVTAMQKYQRFFPIEGREGKLLPRFIAVRNGGDAHLEIVREGNERVLAARFSDASHFYQKDRQTPLDAMVEQLGRLIFQEKLGTMADKRRRLEILAAWLAEQGGVATEQPAMAVRAARLCKADLVSQMVIELPALQGIMGREYALAAGEDPRVADAIAEHYMPRFAGDVLPGTPLGKLLAVADRMDTLVGYVGLGILPSGSSDPYGLRRAAHGVAQILAGEPDMPSLREIQNRAVQAYREVNGLDFDPDSLDNDLRALFEQRIAALLDERGVRYDLIDAALSGGLYDNTQVYVTFRRAEALQALCSDPLFVPTVQAAARITNILRSPEAALAGPLVFDREEILGESARSVQRWMSILEAAARKVNPSMLREESEHVLFDTAYRTLPEVARRTAEYDYEALYRTLDVLREPVNRFFDDVLVMVEDLPLRRNRLVLLQFVDVLYKTLADFTKVVV